MVIGGCPYKEKQKGGASETGPSTTPSRVATCENGLITGGSFSNGTLTLTKESGDITITGLPSSSINITGGASSIVSSNLTAGRALVSNSTGKVAVSNITTTELNYLDGVRSNIQTQIDNISNSSQGTLDTWNDATDWREYCTTHSGTLAESWLTTSLHGLGVNSGWAIYIKGTLASASGSRNPITGIGTIYYKSIGNSDWTYDYITGLYFVIGTSAYGDNYDLYVRYLGDTDYTEIGMGVRSNNISCAMNLYS